MDPGLLPPGSVAEGQRPSFGSFPPSSLSPGFTLDQFPPSQHQFHDNLLSPNIGVLKAALTPALKTRQPPCHPHVKEWVGEQVRVWMCGSLGEYEHASVQVSDCAPRKPVGMCVAQEGLRVPKCV